MTFLARLILCLSLLFAIPADAQETGELTGPISLEATDALDADIAVRLREILGALGGYDDVTVTVNEGIVSLRGTVSSAADAASLGALAARVEGVIAIQNQVVETSDISDQLNPAMERFEARMEQLQARLPLFLIALAVFALIVFLGYLLSSWRKPWDAIAPNRFIANLYQQLVMIAFVIAGLVVALDVLSATALLSTILGAAGIAGLAVGFAVRDTVENYIASILLSIRQPFRPNDVVEINGDEGKVIRLTGRATILLSFDGNHIRIPNATVFKSRIVNYSQNDERRIKFTIGVDPEADIGKARTLSEETMQGLPFVLKQPPALSWIDGITEGGVQIKVTGWINQHETSTVRAKGEALRQVKLAIEAAGIELPDTTYRIRMDSPEARESVPTPTVEPTTIEAVRAETETALERIIDAERDALHGEDLLDAKAQTE